VHHALLFFAFWVFFNKVGQIKKIFVDITMSPWMAWAKPMPSKAA
jgi:hypothetical protein